jgi:type II secretory pathway pseudopilin PulG
MSDQRTLSYVHKNIQGFTLVELMLVIAAIMAAGVAVVATYHVVEANRKTQQQSEMTQVIAGKLSSFALSSGLSSISQSTAIQAGVYPTQMLHGDGQIRNVWGGEAVIVPTPGTHQGATLILASVPAKACIDLIQQTARGFHSASVGTIEVSSDYGQVNLARLTDACNQQQGAATLRFNYLPK